MFSPYFKAFALSGRMGDINTKTQGDALGYVLLPFQGVPVKSSARIGLLLSGRADKKHTRIGLLLSGRARMII